MHENCNAYIRDAYTNFSEIFSSQESGLVPVRLRYAPSSLPVSWSWPLGEVSTRDQGWCHNSWLVAALETAAQRLEILTEHLVDRLLIQDPYFEQRNCQSAREV